MTYDELKTNIANFLNRSDLTDEIADDFIVLTEADFNSKLRVRKMITQSTITIDSETESIPTGFLQVRDFYILSGSTKYPLRYMTPPQMDQVKGTSTTGIPQAYTILGDNFLLCNRTAVVTQFVDHIHNIFCAVHYSILCPVLLFLKVYLVSSCLSSKL